MEINIKLKGLVRIAVFFAFAACSLVFFSYKAYQYVKYKKVLYDIDAKQRSKRQFSYKFEVSDTGAGYILLSPYALYKGRYNGELIVMDFAGKVYVKKEISGVPNDFRQWKVNGQTRYSCYIIDSNSQHTDNEVPKAAITLYDSLLNPLKKIVLLQSGDIRPDAGHYLDGHDFILLSDDHYLTMTYYQKKADNIPAILSPLPGAQVVTAVIQEVANGQVIWQWDASRFPEFYLNSEDGNHFYDQQPQDYMHINSMILDPRDSNLIISMRNNNQVIKVSRKDGSIIWRLGGRNSDFNLTADQVFLRQHNATLIDSAGTLLLFDNGERSIRPNSRILEFQLDEKNKTIMSFHTFRLEDFSPYRGSVQKTGDDYFICGGYTPYLLRVNPATGKKMMKMIYNQSIYRAYLVDDVPGLSKK